MLPGPTQYQSLARTLAISAPSGPVIILVANCTGFQNEKWAPRRERTTTEYLLPGRMGMR
jgi:hypothetical protein